MKLISTLSRQNAELFVVKSVGTYIYQTILIELTNNLKPSLNDITLLVIMT